MKKNLITIILIMSTFINIQAEALSNLYNKENIGIVKPTVMAPDFTLFDLEGQEVTLSDFKGKVVLLNFWASWCPPCREEMPSINSLYEKTKNLDFIILAVNLGDKTNVASKYMKDNKLNFGTLLDSNKIVGSLYGIRSIPTTYFINKKGEIVSGKIGGHQWDSKNVLEIVNKLIEE